LRTVRETIDWLSHLLQIITLTGKLEIRCVYGAPWEVSYETSAAGEIPYHVILEGSATLENGDRRSSHRLGAGDIVLLPHGSAHALHDGGGAAPSPARKRETANFTISENTGTGGRLDMLCGRFCVGTPHDRLIRDYLPQTLVVHAGQKVDRQHDAASASGQLAGLVQLMRTEATGDKLGGLAMLNALSSALFTLTLRVASESQQAQTGLLALAANPRLAPAISAMLQEPAKPWTLPELARLCNMSRATFMRHFDSGLGKSAHDLLTDIRMSLAVNALRNPNLSTESVAELVGYQSMAAFRKAFTQKMGVTPAEWRRTPPQDDSTTRFALDSEA
jgi:AraC family transcriptional activator of mtrCDE